MKEQPHPDDFMVVNIGLEFRAKENPDNKDPHPVDLPVSSDTCLPAEEETAVLLEQIARAIRERRLCGFLAQWGAENPVACGEWVRMPDEELIAKQTVLRNYDA